MVRRPETVVVRPAIVETTEVNWRSASAFATGAGAGAGSAMATGDAKTPIVATARPTNKGMNLEKCMFNKAQVVVSGRGVLVERSIGSMGDSSESLVLFIPFLPHGVEVFRFVLVLFSYGSP